MRINQWLSVAILCFSISLSAQKSNKTDYLVWDNVQGKNSKMDSVKAKGGSAKDPDWEAESYPIGNGYMGANIFGRTDTERVQITEKTLCNEGKHNLGGITNFAELFIDFNHQNPVNYQRSLNLNEAITLVNYEHNGTKYQREYFMSYPDNVMVIKISADKKKKISFTLRPEPAFLRKSTEKYPRSGKVIASDQLATLSGTINYFSQNYEAQFKVINQGGKVAATNLNGKGSITVSDANSVIILIAAGTNYQLTENLFMEEVSAKKLNPSEFPHQKVSQRIALAEKKGFKKLKKDHLEDYQNLFSRVNLSFTTETPNVPTKVLLENYKKDGKDLYPEELMYHFGRYLLISSSRKGTLPSGLQGVWTQYENTPWTGGYWHNINIQMNYWGAFNSNLAETFTPYVEYYQAYLPQAKKLATKYLQTHNPSFNNNGDNGWIIGTGATPFNISAPGEHSGPGTGGFTTKLFWDYYDFTRDAEFLKNVAYPCLLDMSKFFSKTLVAKEDGTLLVEPSASPEQNYKGKYYITKGTTFDQAFVWENHNDLLKAAKIINSNDPFLNTARQQMTKLDPILIGESGQIKEFREEKKYGEFGADKHRHISHLCALYPGTLINSKTKDWLNGAVYTLDRRGNNTTGWAMAHRMNTRARTKDAEKAHEVYVQFIKERTLPNLWTFHPPFQIDGNFGTMAGVAEMLIQSHEGYIELFPALPVAWKSGSYKGLIARGNFEVDTKWKDGKAVAIQIKSRSGGDCLVKYNTIENASIRNSKGQPIAFKKLENGMVSFPTDKGSEYSIQW